LLPVLAERISLWVIFGMYMTMRLPTTTTDTSITISRVFGLLRGGAAVLLSGDMSCHEWKRAAKYIHKKPKSMTSAIFRESYLSPLDSQKRGFARRMTAMMEVPSPKAKK
jgi:hypothetical protein